MSEREDAIWDVVDAIDHQTDQISAGFKEVLSVLRSALVWEEPPPGMLDEIKAKAEALDAQKRAQERVDPWDEVKVTPEEPPMNAGMLVDRAGVLWKRDDEGSWLFHEHDDEQWVADVPYAWEAVTECGPLRPATQADLARHGVDEHGEPVESGEPEQVTVDRERLRVIRVALRVGHDEAKKSGSNYAEALALDFARDYVWLCGVLDVEPDRNVAATATEAESEARA